MSRATYRLILYFVVVMIGIAFADAYLSVIDSALGPLMTGLRGL